MKRRTFLFAAGLAALPLAVFAQPAAPIVVALGDSIATGHGASTPERSYISLITATLGWSINNQAIGGSTIATQQATIEACTAPIVLWLTGYNDMRGGTGLEEYAAMLSDAVGWLTRDGHALHLGNCLRMSPAGYAAYGPTWNRGSDALVATYNDRIASVVTAARANGRAVSLVDACAAYDPLTMGAADLVHPNDAGHAALAQAFLGAIKRRVVLPFMGAADQAYPAP